MATKLPAAASVADAYLAAILEELRAIRELLERPQPLQDGQIRLVEKEPRRK